MAKITLCGKYCTKIKITELTFNENLKTDLNIIFIYAESPTNSASVGATQDNTLEQRIATRYKCRKPFVTYIVFVAYFRH